MGIVPRAITKAAIRPLAVCIGFCLIAFGLAVPVASPNPMLAVLAPRRLKALW